MSAENPMASLRVERTIPASPAKVFAWLADGQNLKHGLPVLRVKRTRDGAGAPWGKGAVRVVWCVGGWFREDITAYNDPHVVWQSSYDVPPLTGGRFGAPLTKRIFTTVFSQVLRAAEQKLT